MPIPASPAVEDPSPSIGSVDLQPVQPSQLLPRISFRTMFLITAAAAVMLAFGRVAGDNAGLTSALASGVFAAVVFLVAVSLTLVVMFILAWGIANLWYSTDGSETPDETDLPPQIIPPRDPVL